MKVVRSSDLAKTVAENWKTQYYDARTKTWHDPFTGSAEEIFKRLLAANGSIPKIKKVLPNGGWVEPWCGECKQYRERVVVFGNEDDGTEEVCPDCLNKALQEVSR